MAPIGRPSAVVPTGTEIDGWPVAQKGAVLATISKARFTTSSRGALGGGSGLVAIGAGAALIKNAVAKRNEAAMQAEALQELGVAAEAEIMPHTMELENETVRLQGTVDEQFQEWRRILRQQYFKDLGLPPPAPEGPEPPT